MKTQSQSFELPHYFWAMPKTANLTVDSKQWKDIVLQTNCKIFACGDAWTVKRKSLGSGMYSVTLEPFGQEKETSKAAVKQTEL